MLNLFRSDGWVKTSLGPAVPGAQIWLCVQPANVASAPPSPLVPMFADPGGLVPITQPILTDGFGHYDFYTVAGVYTLVVAYGGTIQQVYPDQSVGGVGSGGGGTLVLQNNGAVNGDQLLLNLTGAGSVTVSDNGAGTITITGTVFTGPAFKTNGVTNTTQSILNLTGAGTTTVASDAFGNVTISSAASALSGSGAFFLGPGVTDLALIYGSPNWGQVAVNLQNGSLTANQVAVYLFELQVPFTISKCSTECTDSNAGQHGTFGIYSYSGAKLVDGGQFVTLNSSGIQTNTFIPVTLPAGTYWFAQAATNGTAQHFFGQNVSSASNTNGMLSTLLKNSTRAAIAANALSAGVLPATLGTLTPFTPSNSNGDGIAMPVWE